MNTFDRLEIVVLATTEQNTLKETIKILLGSCDEKDISEIVILMVSDECPSASVAREIVKGNSSAVPISIHIQKTPGLYPALYEATTIVRNCSHFLVIGSDLEMDPKSVPEMIEASKKNPDAVICASKFMKSSYRENYGFFHYLFNRAVNTAVGVIAHIKGTELLSTFQIYPADLLREMNFTDLYRTYYQYAFRPVLKGARYIEIPTDYIRRTEGASNYNPKRYIDLGWTFIKTAFDERKNNKK
ncbi:MAG: glycosyltransferase [Clostridia bacterium]|nr:glycosyltransferase [Clostridia bacterium]